MNWCANMPWDSALCPATVCMASVVDTRNAWAGDMLCEPCRRVIFGSSGHETRPKKGVLQVRRLQLLAVGMHTPHCSKNDMSCLLIQTGAHTLQSAPSAMQSYTQCWNRTNAHAIHIKSIVNTDLVADAGRCGLHTITCQSMLSSVLLHPSRTCPRPSSGANGVLCSQRPSGRNTN